ASSERLGLWRRTAQLSHPGLLRLLDRGSVALDGANYVYAVFEFPDDNLASAVASRSLEPNEALGVLSALLDTLRSLHAQGLVHGSIDIEHVVAVGDRIKLIPDDLRESGTAGATHADDIHALGLLICRVLGGNAEEAPAPFDTIIRHA